MQEYQVLVLMLITLSLTYSYNEIVVYMHSKLIHPIDPRRLQYHITTLEAIIKSYRNYPERNIVIMLKRSHVIAVTHCWTLRLHI